MQIPKMLIIATAGLLLLTSGLTAEEAWMGIGTDPETRRTQFETSRYRTTNVTTDAEFAAALRLMQAGRLDQILLRPKPNREAFAWPKSRALQPYGRKSRTGYDPQTFPAIIRTAPSALPTRARISKPAFDGGHSGSGEMSGMAWIDLELDGMSLLFSDGFGGNNWLFENCVFSGEFRAQPYPNADLMKTEFHNLCFRFCFWNGVHHMRKGRISGVFYSNTEVKMEYCTVWHCGWAPTVDRQTVEEQGGATIFNHDVYHQKSINDFNNGTSLYRYCVFADASSHSIHCRPGATIENCLFLRNPITQIGYDEGRSYGNWLTSGRVRNNVFIESSDVSQRPAMNHPRGHGLIMRRLTDCVVEGNIWCFNNTNSPNNMVILLEGDEFDESVVIQDNISYEWGTAIRESVPGAQAKVTIRDNHFDDGTTFANPDHVLQQYRADVVIPWIVENNYNFTHEWITGVLDDCRAAFTPVGTQATGSPKRRAR